MYYIKKSNNLTLYISLKVVSLLFSPLANAGAPMKYGAWENDNGIIDATCPIAFNCTISFNDNGIQQRILADADGNRFVQQMMAEDDLVRGNVMIETFIMMKNNDDGKNVSFNNTGGISTRQLIDVPLDDIGDQFIKMETQLNLGWANKPGEEAIVITRTSFETPEHIAPVIKGDSVFQLKLTENFRYAERRDENNTRTGTAIDINQTVENHTVTGLSQQYQGRGIPGRGGRGRGRSEPYRTVNENGVDLSKFILRQRSGDYVSRRGSAILSNSGNVLETRPHRGGASNRSLERYVDWKPGDTIRAVWAGQICEGCDWMSWANPYNDYFGYVQYDNLSDEFEAVSDFTISASEINVGVEAWDVNAFGDMPLLYPDRGQLGPSPDPYVNAPRSGPRGCCEVSEPIRSDSNN